MVLDTHKEVFAWVGRNADPKEKQQALEMAQVSNFLSVKLQRKRVYDMIDKHLRTVCRNMQSRQQHMKGSLWMFLCIKSLKEMSPFSSSSILMNGIQLMQL